MYHFLELVLMWCFHPFVVGFIILRSKPVEITSPEKERLLDHLFKTKTRSVPQLVFESVVGSALATGVWVLLHGLLCWLLDQSFTVPAFLIGRGTWVDALPYGFAVLILLSVWILRRLPMESRLRNIILLGRIVVFMIGQYILILNYLYWWRSLLYF